MLYAGTVNSAETLFETQNKIFIKMSEGKKILKEKIEKEIKLLKKESKKKYDYKHEWWIIGRIQSFEAALDWIEIYL